MKRMTFAALFCGGLMLAAPAAAQSAISEQDAHAIGVDAYSQPSWTGSVPSDFTRIDAPTPYVWIVGRTKTDGPADYDAVHKIQAGFKITPLSQWGKPLAPVEVKIDPSLDMKTPPKIQVDTMPASKLFVYAAELPKLQPPQDRPRI
jgi:hypothetical protein